MTITPDLPGASQAVELAEQAIALASARLTELGGPDRQQVFAYELAHAGAAPDDPRVQAAVEEHIGLVRLAWEPNRAAYEGLADSYVSDERFARNIGDEATVKLLVAAMKVYAAANLT